MRTKWFGMALAIAGLAIPASALGTMVDFVLSGGSEEEKSFVAASDGNKADYTAGEIFILDLDLPGGTLSISNFYIPTVSNINLNVSFSAPSTLNGTLTQVSPNVYSVALDPFDVVYSGGLNGTLTDVSLGTDDVTLNPAALPGCSLGGPLTLDGMELDLNTGHMELVAGVCPFVPTFSQQPWRLFIRGNLDGVLVPEPGTGALLASGLALLALRRRVRAA